MDNLLSEEPKVVRIARFSAGDEDMLKQGKVRMNTLRLVGNVPVIV